MTLSESASATRFSHEKSLTSGSKAAVPCVIQHPLSAKQRIARACINCRVQKLKCDGHHPCSRCTGLGRECAYGAAKREAMKKHIQNLEKKVEAYDQLLTEIRPRLDSQDKELISRTRGQYAIPGSDFVHLDHATQVVARPQNSLPLIEHIRDNLYNQEAWQTTGPMEGSSEMLQANGPYKDLEKDIQFLDLEVSNNSQSPTSIHYFLDGEELHLDATIDPYARPPRGIADKLLDCYFTTVHPSFPIIARIPFMQQYEMYYTQPELQPTRQWLTVLHLVFAISSKFAQLSSKPWVCEAASSIVCFARAWKLSVIESQLLDHPNLQQAQAEGLMAFFLMSIGHINRSWRVCGIAIRSAIALGLHLRSENKETSNMSMEIRYRVWWSIYTLENILSVMTGRPTGAPDDSSTTPLPIPFDEEQFRQPAALGLLTDFIARTEFMQALSLKRQLSSAFSELPGLGLPVLSQDMSTSPDCILQSNSLYFFYFVDLTVIMQRSIGLLYNASFAGRPWLTINALIMELVHETDKWLSRIPLAFQFKVRHISTDFERQRWGLAFQYYSLRITLSRQSLYRQERQRSYIEASALSQERIKRICIDSACELLDMLPDKPDIFWLVQVSPWWCVQHHLMQTVTVLLVELEFCVRSHENCASYITLHLEKGLHWLYSLGLTNFPAKRAWAACNSSYERLILEINRSQSSP
ncbi:fungal-specific transcription factor domain-containing protein [Aspergillus carlsbadensis]|nr:fungal-specific transcription factor domain-containing protein [Aspergillus carlsbadensis]